jgi:hypothetical protein
VLGVDVARFFLAREVSETLNKERVR